MVIDEKDVIEFFEGVIRGRDERIQIAREKESASITKLREVTVKRELLSSQIDTLEDGLKYHSYENAGSRMVGGSTTNPAALTNASI